MTVNFAHLHLLLNHFPIIGSIVGLGLYLVSFIGKNDDLRRSSFIIFVAAGLLAIATFTTGFGAQAVITGKPGVSNALIQRHEGAAMLSVWFVEATGVFAAIALWHSRRKARPPDWNVLALLVFSVLAVGLIARTGNTGGDISHPEVRDSQAENLTEGPVGSVVHIFEPSPEKFTFAMIGNKWFWAFLMGLHFVGLALIVGTVGILDIRIMGFLKQLPVGPLHRLIPWAMLGLGVNVVTGQLAFIGQPESYVTSIAFWLKMLSLVLLGVNAAAFYLTGIFDRVEPLTAGEDAPMSAKLVAATGLFLWFAMITFGRYIQLFINN